MSERERERVDREKEEEDVVGGVDGTFFIHSMLPGVPLWCPLGHTMTRVVSIHHVRSVGYAVMDP